MYKFTVYLKQGDNAHYIKDGYITCTEHSKPVVKNVTVFCHFNNIQTPTTVTAIDKNVITFQPGYWTFSSICDHFAKNDVVLEEIRAQEKCWVRSENYTLNLGRLSSLISFWSNKATIGGDDFVVSSPVNINLLLE